MFKQPWTSSKPGQEVIFGGLAIKWILRSIHQRVGSGDWRLSKSGLQSRCLGQYPWGRRWRCGDQGSLCGCEGRSRSGFCCGDFEDVLLRRRESRAQTKTQLLLSGARNDGHNEMVLVRFRCLVTKGDVRWANKVWRRSLGRNKAETPQFLQESSSPRARASATTTWTANYRANFHWWRHHLAYCHVDFTWTCIFTLIACFVPCTWNFVQMIFVTYGLITREECLCLVHNRIEWQHRVWVTLACDIQLACIVLAWSQCLHWQSYSFVSNVNSFTRQACQVFLPCTGLAYKDWQNNYIITMIYLHDQAIYLQIYLLHGFKNMCIHMISLSCLWDLWVHLQTSIFSQVMSYKLLRDGGCTSTNVPLLLLCHSCIPKPIAVAWQ